ncbi:MAG: hypothetical protein IOC66_10665 [Burkholderia sp.]|nr:hypothetical protein [Burkholderia sp.]
MADIRITFQGEEFVIPESRAFEIGERVEEIASLPEVIGWAKNPKFFKMSRCIGVILRAAGGRMTDKDVHTQMMADFQAGNPAAYFNVLASLVHVLMDGAPQGKGGEPEKTDAS